MKVIEAGKLDRLRILFFLQGSLNQATILGWIPRRLGNDLFGRTRGGRSLSGERGLRQQEDECDGKAGKKRPASQEGHFLSACVGGQRASH